MTADTLAAQHHGARWQPHAGAKPRSTRGCGFGRQTFFVEGDMAHKRATVAEVLFWICFLVIVYGLWILIAASGGI